MAELRSEDEDCPSRLQIIGGGPTELSGPESQRQQWQNLQLKLTSGSRQLQTLEKEDVLICRTPTDEMEELIGNLKHLLDKRRDEVYFEPSEPSFELSFARTRRGGIKVEAWLDAGNGTTGIYTWDAAGIRFYTTDENIRLFAEQLKHEFCN